MVVCLVLMMIMVNLLMSLGVWWCDAITAAVTDDSDEYSVD